MASLFLPTNTTASPSVTDDEFNSFHSIDRKLYTRLIINLGRDPTESMQVMAFWLWLEQDVVDNLTLVSQMLSLPSTLLSELADESVMCLKCVESDTFPFSESTNELVLLPNFVERNISFQYFYQNRMGVLRGVSKMIGEVCSRAFRDLLEKTIRGTGFFPVAPKGSFSTREKRSHAGVGNLNPSQPPLMEKVGKTSSSFEVGSSSSISGGGVLGMVQISPPVNNAAAYPYWFPLYNPTPPVGSVVFPMTGGISYLTEDQIIENELSQRLSAGLSFLMEENDEVSPDERTIFLTFSKGYPISETEVRDFFTRKFGDFIETIHMQEVQTNEQVLYARVVARSSSVVDAVVEGGRAKYTINGKHVWARKYVRKQKSPLRNTALSIQ